VPVYEAKRPENTAKESSFGIAPTSNVGVQFTFFRQSRPHCMDAIVVRLKLHSEAFLPCWLFIISLVISGCHGKSLTDDNPVFSDAPPRRSLNNRATAAVEQQPETPQQSDTTTVSFSSEKQETLRGNSTIAEVNGHPIFVDDLVASIRLALEDNPALSDDQRQQILRQEIKKRLGAYVEQEIVIHALNQAVPEDRQAEIAVTLEEPFQGMIADIKKKQNLTTDEELNEKLANEGLSIPLLRETFVRIQKVQGYLSTLAAPPGDIDRTDMVDYYKQHLEDYTTDERVRWQEIVVLFDKHGGRNGAEDVMADVVRDLQAGKDFADVATASSDALSAEKRGDMGWLQAGGLADKDLEKRLFELQKGQMTKVYVRDDRFEVYRIADHQMETTTAFQEVQQEIEQKMKSERQSEGRKTVMTDLMDKAIVVTMFDDDAE